MSDKLPRASLERMRAGFTRLEASAFVEEGIELVLSLLVKRAGHIAAVIQPSTACHREFARFRCVVGCLF